MRTESGSENEEGVYVSRRKRTTSTGSDNADDQSLATDSGGSQRLATDSGGSRHGQDSGGTRPMKSDDRHKRHSHPPKPRSDRSDTDPPPGGLVRHSRGRSSARERVANKEYVVTEKRSHSVDAVEERSSLVMNKPPKAKARDGLNVTPKTKTSSRSGERVNRMRWV